MSKIRYKIDFTWSDGTPRAFPTWGEIHDRIYGRFGNTENAYNAYTAYTRDRDGWSLSARDALHAHQWRAVLEETFAEVSRPACAVVIVRRIKDFDIAMQQAQSDIIKSQVDLNKGSDKL